MQKLIYGILTIIVAICILVWLADSYQQSKAETIRAKTMLIMAETNQSQARTMQAIALMAMVSVIVVAGAWIVVSLTEKGSEQGRIVERHYSEKIERVIVYIPQGQSRREFYKALAEESVYSDN